MKTFSRDSKLSKRAAMEMSVGTIVTIVLLMTVMILGLVLIRTIGKSSVENIEAIDQAVKNEISKLFTEDSSRKVVVYPSSREISIKKGDSGGFGFSIRNTEDDGEFSYAVSHSENSCGISADTANGLVILGKSGSGISINSGEVLENPILVKFDISQSVPLCKIRYILNIQKDGRTYVSGGVSADLEIKPE